MSREYRFRGQRVDNGEWVVGHYYTSKYANKNDSVRHFISYGDHWGNYEVKPETVGQYTGLKDKNNNPIYEGDILERIGSLDNFTSTAVETRKRELIIAELKVTHDEFGKFSFGFSINLQITYSERIHHATYEIIGNIHQNRSLIENGE